MPKAMWTRNWPKTKISSDQPSEPSGRFVVIRAIALMLKVEDLQLERAGVLALLGVDEEVAAALDRADVEGEPDALRAAGT